MTTLPHLIDGKLETLAGSTARTNMDPATGKTINETPLDAIDALDRAVASAKAAFPAWSQTPVGDRVQCLFRYKAILEDRAEELAAIVVEEHGKTFGEAMGSVRRGIDCIEHACGAPVLIQGRTLPQIAVSSTFCRTEDEGGIGIDSAVDRVPLGVCAGITPFNFPAMVPMWMFPLAIACGNTFILKPSEKVPLTAVRLAELFVEAGLPAGVFNVVQGGPEVVDALCTHPGISAISFVGSSAVAEHVYALGCRHGKRVQAAGGAKNVLLIMPDADPDATLAAILGSAFGCAGQRCMAGSLLMPVGERTGDEWRERISEALATFQLENTSACDTADMGPVIDASSQARIRQFIQDAPVAGAELAVHDTTRCPTQGFFVEPTVVDGVTPDMDLFQHEVFGPILSVVRTQTLDEAIAVMNQHAYGNGASIFTKNGAAARQFAREIQCGMVGVNVGVPAPMALFSFSGWNRSFFGDLHVQGTEGVLFYTRQKVVLSRWDSATVRTLGW